MLDLEKREFELQPHGCLWRNGSEYKTVKCSQGNAFSLSYEMSGFTISTVKPKISFS